MAVSFIMPYLQAQQIKRDPEMDQWLADVEGAERAEFKMVLTHPTPVPEDVNPFAVATAAPKFREWRTEAIFQTEMGAALFRLRWL